MNSLSIPVVLAALSCATLAEASTIAIRGVDVTVSGIGTAALGEVDMTRSTDLPSGAAWQAGTAITELPTAEFGIDNGPDRDLDPCRFACSPFYGGVYEVEATYSGKDVADLGPLGWETTPFWTVFAPTDGSEGARNEAVLTFGSTRSVLSMLWGSPDQDNHVEFLLGDTVVGDFWGADFLSFNDFEIVKQPGQGAVHVSFSGIDFDAVRFSAYMGGGSFEFSNVVAPVPLPAGALLLLTGLGALAAARRARD
ncbi:VPLPA-CTERM sorting domain-containing protein [Rhodovulum tesquicola]|uniref:Npun_F0296 family exosortase-dependent surface protein n=1 Tax=Rhodovulum tesquicola TaxID=540254 RepID=UPI002097B222|nr:VPLPA-CTERM sorting domain-containing protein [Rhodovulum tesquicola]MCO8145121.1 VPLPA-CTERM sorting domain-containing protein [Rhodovulum tesquicola]